MKTCAYVTGCGMADLAERRTRRGLPAVRTGHLDRTDQSEAMTVLNSVLSWPPSAVRVKMRAAAMRATIRPYSTAVAPCSERRARSWRAMY